MLNFQAISSSELKGHYWVLNLWENYWVLNLQDNTEYWTYGTGYWVLNLLGCWTRDQFKLSGISFWCYFLELNVKYQRDRANNKMFRRVPLLGCWKIILVGLVSHMQVAWNSENLHFKLSRKKHFGRLRYCLVFFWR